MVLAVGAVVLLAVLVAAVALFRFGVMLASTDEPSCRGAARRAWTWEIVASSTIDLRIRGRHDGIAWNLFAELPSWSREQVLLVCTRDSAALHTGGLGHFGAVLAFVASRVLRRPLSRDLVLLARAPLVRACLPAVRESFVVAGSEQLLTPDLEDALVRWLNIRGAQPSERDSLRICVQHGEATLDCTAVERTPAVRALADMAAALYTAPESSLARRIHSESADSAPRIDEHAPEYARRA
jgi:hypothetical protein